MMDWTDRHCRYFMRILSPSVRLYTEMITAAALCHGDASALLRFDACEHPVALQLGGSDVQMMARAAKLGADAGYDEININVGCPSDRVQSGAFGACLPEDYFARTGRALSVAVADSLVSSALTPLFEALGVDDSTGDDGDNSGAGG